MNRLSPNKNSIHCLYIVSRQWALSSVTDGLFCHSGGGWQLFTLRCQCVFSLSGSSVSVPVSRCPVQAASVIMCSDCLALKVSLSLNIRSIDSVAAVVSDPRITFVYQYTQGMICTVHTCVRACVRACVGAYVRACVHACVRVCVLACLYMCVRIYEWVCACMPACKSESGWMVRVQNCHLGN